MFSRSLLPLYVLGYALAFHYVYYFYLADVFNYAYYKYIERAWYDYSFSYALCMVPLFFRSKKESVARFSFDLIYSLVYIPSQLMLIFMWRLNLELYYVTAIALLFGMFIISLPAMINIRQRSVDYRFPGDFFNFLVISLTAVGLVLLFYSYGSTMKLVGFSEIYDLRSEANQQSRGVIVDYLIVWLTFISLPFFFTVSILRRNFTYFAVGVFISISLYAAQGAKIAIFNILIISSLYFLQRLKGDFLAKVLFFSIFIFIIIALILPDSGIWLWAKSIFMVRVYSNAGWMMVTYSEYFYENGYTYFSHIGVLNKIMNSYPFGELSPGQLIGLTYMGTSEANFNANFLASDGIAAVGPLGLPIVAFAYAIFIALYSHFSRKLDLNFLILFSSGFLMSLLNAPLSTAILSGGGVLILGFFMMDFFYLRKLPTNKGYKDAS